MKRKLTATDLNAAVIGGAILGGGGGGFIEAGERAAQLALQVGTPELWSIDEFDGSALTGTVALVGAPAASDPHVQPSFLLRTLELLRRELRGRELVALQSNENGAETTVNGWFQSALTGIPVLDLACNGRAHPTSIMGALGLHTEPEYLSIQAYAGGAPQRYVEGTAMGKLEVTSAIVRRASVEAGGLVAVARNPVTLDYAVRNGAPGAISHAIEIGQMYLEGGVGAVTEGMDARVVATGAVARYVCEQQEGLDVGYVELDDKAKTTLRFVNEYMLLEQNGNRIASFPDLVMTFDDSGRPIVSARVRLGMGIQVFVAPRAKLLLSRTMSMPELYRPLEAFLRQKFAPEAASEPA
jgi:uncharacterized protein